MSFCRWVRIVSSSRQLKAVVAAVAAGLAMAGSVAVADDAPATQPAVPQLAAYRWGISPEQNAAFAKWVGQDVVWAEDFEPADTWDNIQNPGWLLGPWEKWVQEDSRRRLILSVPMLPGAWDRSGPPRGIAAHEKVSLQDGADGKYNDYFKTLAEQLVAHHLGNSILRIGWEMNGGWYTSRASDNPKAWGEYFAQIVKTMRAVDGASGLQFCWNPATDYLQFPAEQCYPGDEYVDIIGLDIYDQSWMKDTYPIPKDATPDETLARQKKVWDHWIWMGNHGVGFWLDFIKKHNKPMAVCEWGVCDRKDGHGGGDNPYFIEKMHKFISNPDNRVVFHCYFDVEAPDGKHQLSPNNKEGPHTTLFPKSAAKFVELFGKPQ